MQILFYHLPSATVLLLIGLTASTMPYASAQFAGNVAGAETSAALAHDADFSLPKKSVDEAQHFITVDGAAEIRVKPTEIRLVLAAVAEAPTAHECQQQAAALVDVIRRGWLNQGIKQDDVFEDFIAILPVYEYEQQESRKNQVLKEVLTGFRYQTNLHVKLATHQQAREALSVAFTHNITDIISFDYWSPDLEAHKLVALKKAIQAARAKSDVLLATDLFAQRPPLVNLQEHVQTIFPKAMYHSYTNTVSQTVTVPYEWRRDIPRISAPRPQTTYYRGPTMNGDSLSAELPMEPEISVLARVRLYYQSPAEKTKFDD